MNWYTLSHDDEPLDGPFKCCAAAMAALADDPDAAYAEPLEDNDEPVLLAGFGYIQ